jgi:DNA-binding FadR family transcriptional regulator
VTSRMDGGVPPKAAAVVAATVRNRIVRGELREGDALPPESELIAEFGISRPSVREALRVLESESLITLQRGARGGARVHAPSAATAARYAGAVLQTQGIALEDVYQAGRLIELCAVDLLAARADPVEVAGLREFLVREEQTIPDPVEFVRLAQQFHVELVAAAGQQTLALFASMLNDIIGRHLALLARPPRTGEREQPRWKTLAAHDQLVELIEAGRVAEARTFWATHLDAVQVLSVGPGESGALLDLIGDA